MFENIPEELKGYSQWVVWKAVDKGKEKPVKVPFSVRGYQCDITNPDSFATFQEAVLALESGVYSGLGFCLTENDPFTFIDLDETDDPETIALQIQIAERIPSFAEVSPSGRGLHIVAKAKLPAGKKAGKIELYSTARYMTVTGNVWRDGPIIDAQADVYSLWEYLGGSAQDAQHIDFESTPSELSDDGVLEKAARAANGQFFIDLYTGNWQAHIEKWKDKSQSSADQSLVNILQVYTQDAAQIERLFRKSALFRPEKAHAIKFNIRKAFDRNQNSRDFSSFIEKHKIEIGNQIEQNRQALESEASQAFESEPSNFEIPENPFTALPPGLIGQLAEGIYLTSPRPVKEIALGAALGTIAGIAGRAYNVSGTGLNAYIAILAKTGTGKEAVTEGPARFMREVEKLLPGASDFAGPSHLASPQGLLKWLAKKPSFVSTVGEFGKKLGEMNASKNASANAIQTALLDLYSKSGNGNIFGAMAYSDREKNIDPIKSPAFSILAESVPSRFYEAVDEKSIQDGFIPRFTIVEYFGDRPELNENRPNPVDFFDLIDKLAKLCAHASMLTGQDKVIDVEFSPDAASMFKAFNLEVDERIRQSDEVSRELWNRVHLKSMKLASLVAVGCNPFQPVITEAMAKWAIAVEEYNAKLILQRFEKGEVGKDHDISEGEQEKVFRDQLKKYLQTPFASLSNRSKRQTTELAHRAQVVSESFLGAVMKNQRCIRNDMRGATIAYKRTLQNMVDIGVLTPLSLTNEQSKSMYGRSGKLYKIDLTAM